MLSVSVADQMHTDKSISPRDLCNPPHIETISAIENHTSYGCHCSKKKYL